MNFNPEKNFNNKKLNPLLDEKLLLSEIINESGEKLKDQAKIEKISELVKDLLIDETIIRQEQLDSEKPDIEKIKADATLEIKKKIKFYIENEEKILECKKIFSNAKNLEELLKIKEPLIEIAKKIGLDYNPITISNKHQEPRTSLERPAEIFKFILNPEYVKAKREELHSINKSDGIYLPNENNPDGGDSWEIKKTDQKETCTIIDTFGHGLSQSYSKLFIEKIISLLGDKDEDLFKVDDFLLDIDTAANFQFQLNTTMIRVEIEGNTLNAKISGDAGFLIYHPETNEVSVCGLSLDYPRIKNIDTNIKKTHTIGAGFNTSPSKFSTPISSKDNVIVFSDSCMKENKKNRILISRTINNFLNEQKGKTQKATDFIERIKKLVEGPEFIKGDDITIVELNKQKNFT